MATDEEMPDVRLPEAQQPHELDDAEKAMQELVGEAMEEAVPGGVKDGEPDAGQQSHIHFGEAHLVSKADVEAGVQRGNIMMAGEEAETMALPQVREGNSRVEKGLDF